MHDRLTQPLPFPQAAPGVISARRHHHGIAPDCRHYRGDRPCLHNRLCDGCAHYEPFEQRLCVIKLGALGDVIRTLCILPELRRRYPQSQITWVTRANACRMLRGHRMIDRLIEFGPMTSPVLSQERFDLAINLDKEPQPCALLTALRAGTKRGVGLSGHGTPVPVNDEAAPYFHLGLSDELKFRLNTKTYPQLIHEALALAWRGQRYELPVDGAARRQVRERLVGSGWSLRRPSVGVNVGAASTFANKMWPADRIAAVIRDLRQDDGAPQVLLLGGPNERTVINHVIAALREIGTDAGVIDTGTDHDEPAFVALVDHCDVLFTGDTMAMHVAIALGKATVVFFGPTCAQEIEQYGLGEKLVADVPCAPCYQRACAHDNACVYNRPPGDAVAAIRRMLTKVARREKGERHALPILAGAPSGQARAA